MYRVHFLSTYPLMLSLATDGNVTRKFHHTGSPVALMIFHPLFKLDGHEAEFLVIYRCQIITHLTTSAVATCGNCRSDNEVAIWTGRKQYGYWIRCMVKDTVRRTQTECLFPRSVGVLDHLLQSLLRSLTFFQRRVLRDSNITLSSRECISVCMAPDSVNSRQLRWQRSVLFSEIS